MENSKFKYSGKGTLEDMPEDKKRELEENKKNVRRIFEEAMAKGGIIVVTGTRTSSKPEKKSGIVHHDSAVFVNGVNPIETLGIIAMTIKRMQAVMNNLMQDELMGSSNEEPSRYIG